MWRRSAASRPGRVVGRPTFALTFSGGGFRATLAALGVARFLADVGRLGDVRFISSVSGGSIANGMIAASWDALRRGGFASTALDDLVIERSSNQSRTSSLKTTLLSRLWRALGPRTRTDLLEEALDERFFHGVELESLDEQVRFIVNAANLTTGVRFAFERDVVGDYVLGLAPTTGTGISLATAVAASAAVPGAFAPVRLPKVRFPCAKVASRYCSTGRIRQHRTRSLGWGSVPSPIHSRNQRGGSLRNRPLEGDSNVGVATAVRRMEEVYASVGIYVQAVSTENLDLPELNDVDVGECQLGQTTAEQDELFANRNNAGADDVVVYFVRSTVPPFNWCAAHPPGIPAAVVAQGATQWTTAHEVGYVLDLRHVDDNDRLMTGNGTSNITNPPPDLINTEVTTMLNNDYTQEI